MSNAPGLGYGGATEPVFPAPAREGRGLPGVLGSDQTASMPERWPSGLRRTLGKRVCVKAYPGFESLSLRQFRLIS